MNAEVLIRFEDCPFNPETLQRLMQRGVDGACDATPGMSGRVVSVRELEEA
jgi:hypothetical protein